MSARIAEGRPNGPEASRPNTMNRPDLFRWWQQTLMRFARLHPFHTRCDGPLLRENQQIKFVIWVRNEFDVIKTKIQPILFRFLLIQVKCNVALGNKPADGHTHTYDLLGPAIELVHWYVFCSKLVLIYRNSVTSMLCKDEHSRYSLF